MLPRDKGQTKTQGQPPPMYGLFLPTLAHSSNQSSLLITFILMCLPCLLNILRTEIHTILKQNVQDSSLNSCHPTMAPFVLTISSPQKNVLDAAMGKVC